MVFHPMTCIGLASLGKMSGVLDLSTLTVLEVPKLDLVTASGELSTLAGISGMDSLWSSNVEKR